MEFKVEPTDVSEQILSKIKAKHRTRLYPW